MSSAVVRDFQAHWVKGYGVADVTRGRAVVTSTRFQAASVSKPVTPMAAVRLAQELRLGSNGDVNPLMTSWRVPAAAHTAARPVTPRSLLSHASGADNASSLRRTRA